jgi:hypothetical protein
VPNQIEKKLIEKYPLLGVHVMTTVQPTHTLWQVPRTIPLGNPVWYVNLTPVPTCLGPRAQPAMHFCLHSWPDYFGVLYTDYVFRRQQWSKYETFYCGAWLRMCTTVTVFTNIIYTADTEQNKYYYLKGIISRDFRPHVFSQIEPT